MLSMLSGFGRWWLALVERAFFHCLVSLFCLCFFFGRVRLSCGLCVARLPWVMTRKVLLLGAVTGGVLAGLRLAKEQVEIRAQKVVEDEDDSER